MLLAISVPSSASKRNFFCFLGGDHQAAHLADCPLLFLVGLFRVEIFDAPLYRVHLLHDCPGLIKLALVRCTLGFLEFFGHLLLERYNLWVVVVSNAPTAVPVPRHPCLVCLDASVDVGQQLQQRASELAAPLAPVERSVSVRLESLLDDIVVVLAARPQVHLRVLEHLVRAQTQEKLFAYVAVAKLADLALSELGVAAGAHNAVEERACILHDDNARRICGTKQAGGNEEQRSSATQCASRAPPRCHNQWWAPVVR
mmetsp:Transcript_48659/g.136013  ORF Transcript_48659/g.136013 Transcript_48659/m.136013 type:complete len:257 (+) Transcript_48659:1150-1920(+)